MTFQASEVLSHYAYLHETQSSKSATDRLYSVEYDISFAPSRQLNLSQSFIVSADASISDFESYPGIVADNRYTKTTSYVTSLRDMLSPRITAEMSHNLRLTRSGSYDLDLLSGLRGFGESSDGQSNDLQLRVSYRIARGISGTATTRGQYIHQDGLDALGNKIPSSRQRILEFNLGLNVNYPFSDRARLTGTFSRSARTDSYTNYVSGVAGTPRINDRDYFLISATFDLVIR
jgi:hypothetical protein